MNEDDLTRLNAILSAIKMLGEHGTKYNSISAMLSADLDEMNAEAKEWVAVKLKKEKEEAEKKAAEVAAAKKVEEEPQREPAPRNRTAPEPDGRRV